MKNRIYSFFIIQVLVAVFATNALCELKMTLTEIKEYKMVDNALLYIIEAQSKNINHKKLKKFRFVNKEKLVSDSIFYLDGNLSTKLLKAEFKKAYFLEGNFIMLDVKGTYKKSSFTAQKAVYNSKKIKFEKILLTQNKRKYKKYKYTIKF